MSDLIVNKKDPDQSIMDIGSNCSKCNRLDFLPFTCEYCKLIFCEDHRRLEAHQCPGTDKFYNQAKQSYDYTSKSQDSPEPISSLFPNRDQDRAKINQLINKNPNPTTIKDKAFRVGDSAKTHKNAFSKFNKFISLQRDKLVKNPSGIKKLFGSSSSSSSSTSNKPTTLLSGNKNPAVDLQLLRSTSKGDKKISPSDRVYVWCLYVDANEEEEDKLKNIDINKQRVGVILNKNWPIGRGLDVISEVLRIKNDNNKTNDVHDRLNIFKLSSEPVLIKNSDRCGSLKTGDVLYLVRGSIE